MTIRETLGRRLRRLRKERGLTVAALAARCDVTATEIQDIEAGRVTDPELIVGVRLAEALCVDAWYLAFGTTLPL
jgi:transcriptional regulator with XRE-family HTH domain